MTLAAGVGFVALGETLLMAIEPAASMPDSVGLALMTSGAVMLTMMSVSILVVVSTLVGAAMPMVALHSCATGKLRENACLGLRIPVAHAWLWCAAGNVYSSSALCRVRYG
jgi:hypothetical protein